MIGCRSGVGIVARDSERNQVLGTADGGKPVTGLLALILAGPLPGRFISGELACLRVIEGAGFWIVDGALALASRGCCIGEAGARVR